MPLSLTVRSLITRALQSVRVQAPGEPLTPAFAATGLELVQELLDDWSTQALMVVVASRTVYPLVANQGGPTTPYTIGPGGDFDTTPADRPLRLSATLLLAGSPAIEIPLSVLTDDEYDALPIKTLASSPGTWLHYTPGVPLGTIELYPVPTTSANSLVVYADVLPTQVLTLDDVYVCPPGWLSALRLGLAEKCIGPFDVPDDIAARVSRDARQALLDVQAAQVRMTDLGLDRIWLGGAGGSYDILSDQGS